MFISQKALEDIIIQVLSEMGTLTDIMKLGVSTARDEELVRWIADAVAMRSRQAARDSASVEKSDTPTEQMQIDVEHVRDGELVRWIVDAVAMRTRQAAWDSAWEEETDTETIWINGDWHYIDTPIAQDLLVSRVI